MKEWYMVSRDWKILMAMLHQPRRCSLIVPRCWKKWISKEIEGWNSDEMLELVQSKLIDASFKIDCKIEELAGREVGRCLPHRNYPDLWQLSLCIIFSQRSATRQDRGWFLCCKPAKCITLRMPDLQFCMASPASSESWILFKNNFKSEGAHGYAVRDCTASGRCNLIVLH